MRVQTEEWRRFIPGVRMYKGKKTLFYNGENHHNWEERKTWQVIIVKIIPETTFMYCENLETVIMTDTVRRVDHNAFNNCTSLSYIRLSKNLEYIGEESFNDCESLTSIFIPSSCREIGKEAFAGCEKLIILSIPQNVQLGDCVIDGTALMKASHFETDENGEYDDHNEEINNWLKNRHNKCPLHKLCYGEQPTPDLDSYNEIDWYKKDGCGLTPVDYYIANFGEHDYIQYLPEYVKHLIKENKLKGMSTDEIVEGQLAWQQQKIASLQSQFAQKDNEKDHFMSLQLLE